MTLSEMQAALEMRGLTEGEQRYLRRLQEAYSHSAASGVRSVQDLMAGAIDWVAAEMRLRIEEANDATGRGSNQMPAWMAWADKVGVETAAYLTLKAALDGIGQQNGMSLRGTAVTLMRMMIDEVRAETFREAKPIEYANAMNHGMGVLRGARSDRLIKRMRYHDVAIPASPNVAESVLVGTQLLAVLVEATGLFYVDSKAVAGRGHQRTKLLLVPSSETLEWLAKRDDRLRLTMPLHPPMLIMPRDWTQGVSGGYHFDLEGTLPLVRRSSTGQGLALASLDTPLVYSALNNLQRTGWQINIRVLDVLKLALDGRIPEIMPPPEDEPIPPRPKGLEIEDDTVREWRRIAADIHQRNERRRTRRADAERTVVVAERYRESDQFYFPYSLDFRGRAYPATEFLNPHGPDVVQGLLQFSEGVPLTSVGAGWLAVHGANTLGESDGVKLSKLTFQERHQFIKDHSLMISDIANDPLSNRQWTLADEPWQFLAFCFEWENWLTTGPGALSFLPVGLDGASNGLQHFSAMLRDPVGAASVNLTDTDRPNDIYASVAEKLVEKMQEQYDHPMAAAWLSSGLLSRSLIKQPVMTLSYGATRYGFVDQILTKLRGDETLWKTATDTFRPRQIRIREAVQFLSGALWDVLPQVVGGALEAMAWLQSSAERVTTVTGGPIQWTVPVTSFPARQEYWKSKRTQVKTLMAGTLVRPSAYVDTNKPDKMKVRNAIAPNVVHSLDAAMMAMAVTEVIARGAIAVSAVHDSFKVHAEYVPILSDVLRVSMMELYNGEYVLENLARQWRALGAEIDDPPPQGNFNVEELRHARYAFS